MPFPRAGLEKYPWKNRLLLHSERKRKAFLLGNPDIAYQIDRLKAWPEGFHWKYSTWYFAGPEKLRGKLVSSPYPYPPAISIQTLFQGFREE